QQRGKNNTARRFCFVFVHEQKEYPKVRNNAEAGDGRKDFSKKQVIKKPGNKTHKAEYKEPVTEQEKERTEKAKNCSGKQVVPVYFFHGTAILPITFVQCINYSMSRHIGMCWHHTD